MKNIHIVLCAMIMQIFAINCGNLFVRTSKKASSDDSCCDCLPEKTFAGFLKATSEKPLIPILYCNDCEREKRFAGARITTRKEVFRKDLFFGIDSPDACISLVRQIKERKDKLHELRGLPKESC